MDKFKELPLFQKVLIITGFVIVAVILFYPDDEPVYNAHFDSQTGQSAYQNQPQPAAGQTAQNREGGSFFSRFGNSTGKQVTFFDRGLQMEMGTQTLATDWEMQHDIYINPQSTVPERYFVEYRGPNGEIIRSLGMENYAQFLGQNFEQTWRTALQNSIRGELQNLSVGNLQRSQTIPRLKSYREAVQQGYPTDPLEVQIRGTRNGQPYEGVFQIIHIQIPEIGDFQQQAGIVATQIVLAPANLLAQTIEKQIEMEQSYIKNPHHDQRTQQIAQANFQRNFQQNQQRIDNQRNQFAEQNRQWSENFFGSWNTGSSTGGSGYSSNDQFLDAITGHSTFDDPHTGHQRQIEGHYRYNFTDGMGNFYGTDDPTFDYRSLQGNWQPIDPLRPNN